MPEFMGPYQLRRLLGEGGMGQVYEGLDRRSGERVAVKLLRGGSLATAREKELFAREARVGMEFGHPGLVRVLAVEIQDGVQPYLVMEYLPGPTLKGVLEAGPLAPLNALDLAGAVLEALAFVHAQGIIHRDIKTGNIMLDTAGRPRLMDFGLTSFSDETSLSRSGIVFGSPADEFHGGIYYTNAGGLSLRTNLGNTRMTIDAAGSVGIGTTTPEAPLHVLNGSAGTVTAHASSAAVLERNASNFLSLLAPDASERGVAFGSPTNAVHGGMYYSNANGLSLRTGGNNTRLRIDSSGLVGIGSGTPAARLHVVDAAGGNTSVILPSDAIGAAEIMDEPGAAESEFDQPQIALDGSLQTLLSTTITAPDTGFVLVIASAQCSFINHTNGTTSDANFGVSNNAASLPTNQDVELLISNAAPTGVYRFPVTVHALFPVLAGARTFYFLGQELSGNAVAQDIQLTAVFLPTAYGAAGFQGDEPGAGDDDDPDSARGPLSPEEIEWERAEAIRLNEERLIREREQLAAEVEELRALRRELEALRDDLTGDADQADDQADE